MTSKIEKLKLQKHCGCGQLHTRIPPSAVVNDWAYWWQCNGWNKTENKPCESTLIFPLKKLKEVA